MTIFQWILLYLFQCFVYKWILSWGGARWLEGIKAAIALGWMTWDWTAEQIRFYILLIWIIHTVWFVVGLFSPDLRL